MKKTLHRSRAFLLYSEYRPNPRPTKKNKGRVYYIIKQNTLHLTDKECEQVRQLVNPKGNIGTTKWEYKDKLAAEKKYTMLLLTVNA